MKMNPPVNRGDKDPVEVEDDAEIRVAPDPHGEGEAHHADDGKVGGAVQEDHHVNQGKLLHLVNTRMLSQEYRSVALMLNLQPNEDHDVDNQHCNVADRKDKKVESCHWKIFVDEKKRSVVLKF